MTRAPQAVDHKCEPRNIPTFRNVRYIPNDEGMPEISRLISIRYPYSLPCDFATFRMRLFETYKQIQQRHGIKS